MTTIIEKSGTGIEKSGTGIEKSGTGVSRFTVMAAAFATMMFAGSAVASDARLAVSNKNGHAIVSVHGEAGVMIGVSQSAIDTAGYARVPLYSILQASESAFSMGLMVQGSGSGASGESAGLGDAGTLVQGSGSGQSKESFVPGGQVMVQGSGSGASGESCNGGPSLMVQGSGSGASGESCSGGPSLMVQGSGSGAAGESCSAGPLLMVQGSGSGASTEVQGSGSGASTEVQGSGSGASTEVQGSGSGAAGESAGCSVQPWGFAEVVVDAEGTHVVVHRIERAGASEYLLAYLPTSTNFASTSLQRGMETDSNEFVALP